MWKLAKKFIYETRYMNDDTDKTSTLSTPPQVRSGERAPLEVQTISIPDRATAGNSDEGNTTARMSAAKSAFNIMRK